MNILRTFCFLIFSVFLLGIQGCPSSHENVENLEPVAENEKLTSILQMPESIDFNIAVEQVLKTNCFECHSSKDQRGLVNLETLDDAFGRTGFKRTIRALDPERSSLYQSLIIPSGSRHMPPLNKPQLNDQQIELIRLWILNGAKLKVDDVVEPEPTEEEELAQFFQHPEQIDYKTVNEFIFKPHCASCHSIESPESIDDAIIYGANLSNYRSIFSPFLPVVTKGDHLESSIFQSIVVNQSMPPVEKGYELLSANLNRLLRLWIINCAIEDYSAIENEELIEDEDGIGKVRLCEDQ